jgi:predicted metalloendopeptidase
VTKRFPVRAAAALVLAALIAFPAAGGSPGSGGFEASEMDTSASACREFYRYAVGGWLQKNPVPADYPSWGAFNELAERNREALRQILERLSKSDAVAGSEERKLGDFYGSCMDEASIEAQGAKPLAEELRRIAAITTLPELEAEIARLQTFGVNAAFQFGSEQDRKDSESVISSAAQGGLGLPERDYYTKTDKESKELRAKYVSHVAKLLALAGEKKAGASAHARTVLAFETKLAMASMTPIEQRDPIATFNKMGAAQLSKLTPNFSWSSYFKTIGATDNVAVNVQQPKFFQQFSKQMTGEPLATWKIYLKWQLLSAAAPYLSKAFVDEDFDFNERTLQGTQQILPRWKRCVSATDQAMGFALGRPYVAQYFPPESKVRMDQLVKNLIAALSEDLATLPWMSEATSKAALEKLSAFAQKIGYPDKWRDYSALAIAKGPYVSNVIAGTLFEFHRDLAKIGKPVDRTEWGMTPPTVNAYYNPLKNEIVFPAGILQPPFFDRKADDAVNYGAIGAVIGHEMTHGFDDQGRKFDAKGNLTDWWTKDDAAQYEARAGCVEKQFSGYEVEPGLHEKGQLVLGESIADLGGLSIAYRAMRKALEGKPEPAPIDGLTADQRFFLGWARVWATNDRPEFARLMVNVNPHPLDRFRAIGPPSNMAEFAKAFSCKAGDPMVRAEACRIW